MGRSDKKPAQSGIGKVEKPRAYSTAIDRLNARRIKTETDEGYHLDGKGLYLLVKPTGAKSWVLRFALNGKKREMGLGAFPEVGLADARQKRDTARNLLADGIDPIEARDAQLHATKLAESLARAKAITFDDCAARFIAVKSAEWTNAKHTAQWTASLAAHASPVFGKVAIADVDTDLVLKALTPIWKTKTETATRVRQRIEAVLDWAKVSKLRVGENPAIWRGNLDKLLPQPGKIAVTGHHPALPYRDVYGFLQTISQSDAMAARALEIVILTATRTSETVNAQWSEIDFDAGVWTIPAKRMKAKREHRVPLSAAALAIFNRLHELKTSAYVFPSPSNTEARNKPLSNMAMLTLLMRMKRRDITPHGFRSTFRDWCAEQTSYPRELAEAALAHVLENKTEAAYQRGDLLEKRARLMESWAEYCNSAPQVSAKVTPIGGRSRASRA
jgi:integrase